MEPSVRPGSILIPRHAPLAMANPATGPRPALMSLPTEMLLAILERVPIADLIAVMLAHRVLRNRVWPMACQRLHYSMLHDPKRCSWRVLPAADPPPRDPMGVSELPPLLQTLGSLGDRVSQMARSLSKALSPTALGPGNNMGLAGGASGGPLLLTYPDEDGCDHDRTWGVLGTGDFDSVDYAVGSANRSYAALDSSDDGGVVWVPAQDGILRPPRTVREQVLISQLIVEVAALVAPMTVEDPAVPATPRATPVDPVPPNTAATLQPLSNLMEIDLSGAVVAPAAILALLRALPHLIAVCIRLPDPNTWPFWERSWYQQIELCRDQQLRRIHALDAAPRWLPRTDVLRFRVQWNLLEWQTHGSSLRATLASFLLTAASPKGPLLFASPPPSSSEAWADDDAEDEYMRRRRDRDISASRPFGGPSSYPMGSRSLSRTSFHAEVSTSRQPRSPTTSAFTSSGNGGCRPGSSEGIPFQSSPPFAAAFAASSSAAQVVTQPIPVHVTPAPSSSHGNQYANDDDDYNHSPPPLIRLPLELPPPSPPASPVLRGRAMSLGGITGGTGGGAVLDPLTLFDGTVAAALRRLVRESSAPQSANGSFVPSSSTLFGSSIASAAGSPAAGLVGAHAPRVVTAVDGVCARCGRAPLGAREARGRCTRCSETLNVCRSRECMSPWRAPQCEQCAWYCGGGTGWIG